MADKEAGFDNVSRAIPPVAITFSVATVAACCLRILARKLSKAGLWWDDWLIIPAVIFALAATSIMLYLTTGSSFTAPAHVVIRSNLAGYLLWVLSLWATKCAIVAFYWRLFGNSKPNRVKLLWLLGLVCIWGLGTLFAAIFSVGIYSGNEKEWYQHSLEGAKIMAGTAGAHIFTDVVILLVPLPWVWRLDIPRVQKLSLVAVFLFGIFTIAASVVRFAYLIEILNLKRDQNFREHSAIWMIIEINVTTICANVPSLMPLLSILVQAFQKLRQSMNHKRQGNELIQDIIPFSKGPPSSAVTEESKTPVVQNTSQWGFSEVEANEKQPPELPTYPDRRPRIAGTPKVQYWNRQELASDSIGQGRHYAPSQYEDQQRKELEAVSPRSELYSPQTFSSVHSPFR